MTVSSEINKSGPYTGNGVTTVFAYGFRILDASHIEVIRTEGGIDTTVSPSAYSVSGVGSDSGNVVFSVAPASGQSITIIRNVPFTQSTDLENQGAYYAETIEQSLDLAAMRDQQLAEELSRAVKVPVGRAPLDTDEAVEGLLRFSDIYQGASDEDISVRVDGSALEGGDLYYNNPVGEYRFWNGSRWVPFSILASLVTYRYLATSGQTVFSGADLNGLTPTSMQSGAILVHINGLSIIEGVDFEIGGGGSTVTLTTGAAVSDEIVITEFKQIPLSQLPAQVASDAAAAEAARIAAEAAEASAMSSAYAIGGRFYATEAAFIAQPVDPLVNTVFVLYGEELIGFKRTPGTSVPIDILHPDGSYWAKATLTNANLIAAFVDILTAGQFPTYSEGAFLPEFTWSDFSAGSVSGDAVTGSYVRQGRMVYIDASFVNITVTRATDSGTIRIGNLPYPAAANTFGTLHIRRCSGIDLRDAGSAPPMNATVAIAGGQNYGTLTINPANAATFSAGVARCASGAGAVTLQVTGWYEVQD